MAMNIKDAETEQLAAEVAALTGESKTAAVRAALRERRDRLNARSGVRRGALRRFLEDEVWPRLPPTARDEPPMTKAEREELLGYGPEGV
ncbi:type II toxin-antitoxin system VapB family antitoxin [Actinophytocola sp.]|uniref:type II toxin-antitoxin system VapB family antitoxin n=1 Tax=Actinophytocola sp. TaxID=1872138 RepID=UPI00389B0B86